MGGLDDGGKQGLVEEGVSDGGLGGLGDWTSKSPTVTMTPIIHRPSIAPWSSVSRASSLSPSSMVRRLRSAFGTVTDGDL